METARVLLVDDDEALCQLLGEYLQSHGFTVSAVHGGAAVLALAQIDQTFDIICLDIMMPDMSGLDVISALRAYSCIPIIMVTGRGDDIDRVIGLEMGADDYLAKPCNPRELVARIRAVLRRVTVDKSASLASFASTAIEGAHLNGLKLYPSRREACLDDQQLQLTGAEFNVLMLLVKNQGQIVSKAVLTEKVLHRTLTRYDRSIDVHVSRVRQKLSEFKPDLQWIKTVRGAGYIFIAMEHD